MSKWTRNVLAGSAVVGLVAAGMLAVDGLGSPAPDVEMVRAEDAASSVSRPALDSDVLEGAFAFNEAFVVLADRVTKAVVRIEVRRDGRAVSMPQPELPEPFRRFFEFPDGRMPQQDPTPVLSGGTGFIISPDGYIATNNHVVGDADEITVWLTDRHSYEAELVGRDPTTDVAVIRIDAEDLPALTWGSSDDLRVGEWVMAVGNPGLGGAGPLDYTVTSGIVSAKNRPLQLIGRSLERDPAFGQDGAGYAIENFIQTDAVINPGNSGGPLVNLRGEVVGINSAIASTSGFYQGYGFAVPGDLARRVVEDLIDDGRIARAWLGVSVTGVTAEDAEVYELPGVYGALVQRVTEDSPAARAGLESQDVIVDVEGERVDRGGGLQQLVAERSPGERVRIGVYRDGALRHFDVRLGEAPFAELEDAAAPRAPRTAALDRLGIEVRDMTARDASRLGYDDVSGVVVSNVEPLGPAARRGVTAGLRVLRVNDVEVEHARDVEAALEDAPESSVVTLVLASPDGSTRVTNVRAR